MKPRLPLLPVAETEAALISTVGVSTGDVEAKTNGAVAPVAAVAELSTRARSEVAAELVDGAHTAA